MRCFFIIGFSIIGAGPPPGARIGCRIGCVTPFTTCMAWVMPGKIVSPGRLVGAPEFIGVA